MFIFCFDQVERIHFVFETILQYTNTILVEESDILNHHGFEDKGSEGKLHSDIQDTYITLLYSDKDGLNKVNIL